MPSASVSSTGHAFAWMASRPMPRRRRSSSGWSATSAPYNASSRTSSSWWTPTTSSSGCGRRTPVRSPRGCGLPSLTSPPTAHHQCSSRLSYLRSPGSKVPAMRYSSTYRCLKITPWRRAICRRQSTTRHVSRRSGAGMTGDTGWWTVHPRRRVPTSHQASAATAGPWRAQQGGSSSGVGCPG